MCARAKLDSLTGTPLGATAFVRFWSPAHPIDLHGIPESQRGEALWTDPLPMPRRWAIWPMLKTFRREGLDLIRL